MEKVLVTGISGFVGKAVAQTLYPNWQVIGASRSGKLPADLPEDKVSVISCDLFNYHETLQALHGVDYAIYLVHSMLPRTRLTQASFQDLDFVLADNFARAAKQAGVKQIIYLGGLIPYSEKHTSAHLESRLEVERLLGAYGTPVTALRAGMIIGKGGSSFHILCSLVKKLPLIVMPSWGKIPTQPIALKDVVRSIQEVLGAEEHFDRSYDIGAPQPMSYRRIMEVTAKLLDKSRRFFILSWITPGLSRLWISLITGAPRNLVAPLLKSLTTKMIVDSKRRLEIPSYQFQPVEEALTEAVDGAAKLPYAFKASNIKPSGVRSIQRIKPRRSISIQGLPAIYFRWLDGLMGLIRVDLRGPHVFFHLRFWNKPLLQLEKVSETPTYASFVIVGGMLTLKNTGAVFEFRKSPLSNDLFTEVHDFEPSLPWTLYAVTQAKIHALVMHRFGRFLEKLSLTKETH